MPGFLYEDTGVHNLGTWYPLVLMTMYNIMDLVSSYIPLIEVLKLESRKGLLVVIFSRFLLIPAFFFTAKYGAQGWMILLVSYLGLTNGYLTVCVYTVVPRGYTGPEQNALGNLLALCLLSGIFVGVAIEIIRSDNGTEFFSAKGITYQRRRVATPQQNGRIESHALIFKLSYLSSTGPIQDSMQCT
ncbi:equilibrative nucleotide transporter 3-like protein [Trifolium pratense]|uniref:Equilibrative nucleotide transporter 3-like protein n=1 Tax=Trifolium pratense TaxID=57577 RepID=A0A2K3LB51_TRIPR|nr:equilibrative nucleotide transporter 3-like protein [Trifolium pratense]